MKPLVLGLSLLLLSAFTSNAAAQSATAEFRLDMTFKEGKTTLSKRAIGYDPRATAGYDSAFAEDFDYPGSTGFIPDFYMEYPNPDADHSYSRVIILDKPDEKSFKLQYIMDLSLVEVPATLSWDQSSIPFQVNAIQVTPIADTTKLLVDLKKQSSITLTDLNQRFDWQRTLVTIYYNMQPTLAVDRNTNLGSDDLIQNLGAYPNPMLTNGRLSFDLGVSSEVTVAAYDATGRKCLDVTTHGNAGHNTIDLTGVGPNAGVMLVHVEAESGTRHETKSVMVMKQ